MVLSKIHEKIARLGEGLINVAVPPTCMSCDRHVARPGGCCAECWSNLRFISKPFCPVMGTPFEYDMGGNFLCAEAIADPPPFDRLRAVMLYNEGARRMVSGLKYADRLDLAPAMAAWMATCSQELLTDADVIVPIPLHARRLWRRRYNQSAELARHLAERTGTGYRPDVLKRRKATRQQVGLSERERENNVSGAFVVAEEHRIHVQARNVLLVDDVYTTGATAKAATRALKRGGAARVDVVVFAKVETFEL